MNDCSEELAETSSGDGRKSCRPRASTLRRRKQLGVRGAIPGGDNPGKPSVGKDAGSNLWALTDCLAEVGGKFLERNGIDQAELRRYLHKHCQPKLQPGAG